MENKIMSLAGNWKIVKDPKTIGKIEGWQKGIPQDAEIKDFKICKALDLDDWTMNYSYAQAFPSYHGMVWFYKELPQLPKRADDEIILIEFERAGYLCEVFVNGEFVGEHRHHEERFSYDITPYLKGDGKDLIAVRCFEPLATGEAIEGIKLAEIPNGVWADSADVIPGVKNFSMEAYGGIICEVRLLVVPKVRIDSAWLRPDWKTGKVNALISLVNAGEKPVSQTIKMSFSEHRTGSVLTTIQKQVDIPVGTSEIELVGEIENHVLWDTENPFLYVADIELSNGNALIKRFGFKDFRFKNGFYMLNGKRIFLKCAHCVPTSANAINMKGLGFNTIRSIHRSFNSEVLNICDEIGMLVIESSISAWGMKWHANTKQMLYDYTANMMKMHRSHACLSAFYIFNEQYTKEVFDAGVEILPDLRKVAPDHIILLASGRWEKDSSVASASNPGSSTWDVCLNGECNPDYPNESQPFKYNNGAGRACGDVHLYNYFPLDTELTNWIRTMGKDLNPVFISEGGIGSQIDTMLKYLSNCKKPLVGHITTEMVKNTWKLNEEFLDFYDFRDLYPVTSDFAKEAHSLNGYQRTLLINAIRSNPMINGFSLTSVGISNEGIYEGKHVVKENLAHSIQEGWEALRWALFTNAKTIYAGKPVDVEVVLCNEDVLKPGKYSATAYIRGEDGCVWKKDFIADYPEKGFGDMPPLAATMLKDSVVLPEGEYKLCARLLEEDIPFCTDMPFRVLAPSKKKQGASVYTLNLSENIKNFLNNWDIETIELTENSVVDTKKLILVGDIDEKSFELLKICIERGSKALFTDINVFEKQTNALTQIAGENAKITMSWGWLYHHDHIAKTHPIFDRLNKAGILDMDAYGEVYPHHVVSFGRKPDKTICAALMPESTKISCGLTFGEYNMGKGKAIINGFRFNEALGKEPYADQLLLNVLDFYC